MTELSRIKWIVSSLLLFCGVLLFQACKKQGLDNNTEGFLPVLSDYGFFKGDPSRLIPTEGMIYYELATPLFSDYSEKQRLIKLPQGTRLVPHGDGLPEFPEGSMIVKTFFYYHDLRDTSLGKKIIETRLLIRETSSWKAATYLWNEEQTDAVLFEAGLHKVVNWIDSKGEGKVIVYRVPANKECSLCHRSENSIIPIGPKLRNLNRTVLRNNSLINQLSWLQQENHLNTVDPSSITFLPNWENQSLSLRERSRAYLDVNCAHCHYKQGFAPDENFYPAYEETDTDSKIRERKDNIIKLMENGEMPKTGTTIVHEEAVELLKAYANSL